MYNLMIADGYINSMETMDWNQLEVREVYRARNIGQAQDSMQKHQMDILLLDMNRPFEGGYQLLTWVREHYAHIPVIIYTDRADFFEVQKAMRLGISDYLLKSSSEEEIKLSIERVIDERRKLEKLQIT